MPNPLLSICIPTYNRAPFLRQCLDSITAQFTNPEIAREVEVVISDNASTDNTTEVVRKFQQNFPQICYTRNSENLGFDKNILNVVAQAHGQYCWFMGDDDALFSDALAVLLPILAGERYQYLLANSWGYNKEMSEQALSRPNLSLIENKEYNSLRDFVKNIPDYRDMTGYFGGMSSQIFKREVWKLLQGKEEYIGSLAIHLFVILKGYRDLPMCIIAKPLVKNRSDNMRWEAAIGLETISKRSKATNRGLKWILNLYEIPYSKTRMEFEYYKNLAYSWLMLAAKKTLFRNERLKALAKKLVGK